MPDPDARDKVFIAHSPSAREFAETLAELFRDVLRLGPHAIRRSELSPGEAGKVAALDPSLVALANQVPVLIVVDLSNVAEPVPPLSELWAERDNRLSVRVSTRAPQTATEVSSCVELPGWDTAMLEDLIGRVAGALGIQETLALLPQRGRLEALRRMAYRRQQAGLGWFRRLQGWAAALGVISLLGGAVYAWFYSDWRAGHFEFEADSQGWVAQSTTGQGCLRVNQSDDESRWGAGSLELEMELDPRSSVSRTGQAWVDLRQASLASGADALDLRDKTVTAWVYAPRSAAGPEKHPNGFQLFVKDTAWRAQFGPWVNVRPEQWTELVLSVGSALEGESLDSDFAPDRVAGMGVQLSLGGESDEGFSGLVYLDSVDW